ncbi:MAG: hypothetical protein O2819_08510, partial [Planctomycetota bacterium]|nr:hypothetical protein [Planctomycetota bacterium]
AAPAAPAAPKTSAPKAPATSAPAVVATRSHRALAWSPTQGQANMVDMMWVTSWRSPAEVAAESLTKPEGKRVLFFFANIVNEMARNPADTCNNWTTAGSLQGTSFMSPWMDNGIAATRAQVEAFIADFAAAGGKVDMVILDNEKDLQAAHFMGNGNGDHWSAVMQDPRFSALAGELGFSNLRLIGWDNSYYHTWNQVMGRRFDAAINASVFEPIRAIFPAVQLSNYNSFAADAKFSFPDLSGHRQIRASGAVGTQDSRPFYGRMTAQAEATRFDGVTALGSTGFDALRNEVNAMRGTDLSSARRMQAWIANKSWGGDGNWAPTRLANSRHWDELVLQLGMHGVTDFIYWTEVTSAYNNADQSKNPVADQDSLNALLSELNSVVGQGSGEPIFIGQVELGERAIATGMRVGSSIVWRFSFSDGVDSVQVSFDDGSVATVSRESGRSGAWYAHDAGRQFAMAANGGFPAMQLASN